MERGFEFTQGMVLKNNWWQKAVGDDEVYNQAGKEIEKSDLAHEESKKPKTEITEPAPKTKS